MTNRHFGNIGDVWKHLPLAEIIAIERPERYWESHAGSAQYRLTHSEGRDYGVFQLLRSAGESIDLGSASFLCLLDGMRSRTGRLTAYPGSPRIAMELLGNRAEYLFCDLDGASLASIARVGRSLGIPPGALRRVRADGVRTLAKEVAGLARGRAAGTLILIDPCAGDDPFRRSETRPSPMDLFSLAASIGAKAVLWYWFDSCAARESTWQDIGTSLADYGVRPGPVRLWAGEICLAAIDSPGSYDPGVKGCGILCGNLADSAVSASSRLGYELSRIYRRSRLPDGASGAFDFKSIHLEVEMADGGRVVEGARPQGASRSRTRGPDKTLAEGRK
jgi:hypothetical protein